MKCYLCERYSTTDKSNFKRHHKTCIDKLYCNHCTYKTSKKIHMKCHMRKNHMDINHMDTTEFICKKCNSYKSKKKFNIKRHQRTCSMKLNCATCSFSTTNKKMLIKHLQPKSNSFNCPYCKNYKTIKNNNYNRHLTVCKRKYKCKYCNFLAQNPKELRKHLIINNHTSVFCDKCGKKFPNRHYFLQHKSVCEQIPSEELLKCEVLDAIHKKFKVLRFTHFKMSEDFKKTMHVEMLPIIKDKIQKEANSQLAIKWYLAVQVSLYKRAMDDESWAYPVFKSSIEKTFWNEENIVLERSLEKLNEKLELFCNLGSGWIFDRVLRIDLSIAQYDPLSASSFIPTPKRLEHEKIKPSILNIKNLQDDNCFIYCVLAGIYNINDTNPEPYLKLRHEINLDGLNFPMQVRQIEKFEKQNLNISISVFGYEDDTILPLYIAKDLERKFHINLLLLTQEEKSHFILIRNKNSLFKHVLYPKSHHKVYICDYCLNRMSSNQAYNNHVARCKLLIPQATKYPTEDNKILEWKNFNSKIKRPITIYADFETMNINGNLTPSSFAYVIVDDTQSPISFREFRNSQDVVRCFLLSIIKDVDDLTNSRIDHEEIVWTDEDRLRYKKATHCHICEESFDLNITDSNHPMSRVADHCHFEFPHTKPTPSNTPGRFRGAAHRQCNAAYQSKLRISVILHNLKNFDGHLIITEIGKFIRSSLQFKCIPMTIEKYSTFSLGNIDFIDSLEFLNASLDSLASTLDQKDMKIMKHYFPDESQFKLVCKKGIFPYEYIDSYEKLENDRELPPLEAFFNKLSDSQINQDDYDHAKNVWNTFHCQTLGEYQDLYNKCDVLLLADVFENFRSTMLHHYGLDPCNFISFPSLSWTAMLKMTKVKLELITDPDIYLMFEQGIRGGVAVIPTRYARAEPGDSSLLYVDCNNLYGAALSSYLPIGDFQFVSINMINQVLSTPDDSDIGFICEVDLYVPDKLHDYMNDFPLAPSSQKIQTDQLSPYQKSLAKTLNYNHVPTDKLITSLEPKANYIIHYRNLKLYLQLGMVLTKVHKIVQFKQSAWMKPYIDFNTEKRAQASSKFEQNLFKLASNSCFGRCLMNVRRHKNFTLVTNESKAKSYINKPTFKQFSIFNKDLVGILYNKTIVTLNKPIYAGMVTLEVSKLIMYDYFYNTLKPKYGNNMTLCMTDTDSLLLQLKTKDLNTDLMSMIDTLDTSNYPTDHPLYSSKWKKIVGKFKDESPADPIIEFVGLRAKMYAFETEKSKNKCIGKGIPRANLRTMNIKDYKKSLFQESISSVQFHQISSVNHSLYMKSMKKIALSPMDDKRYLLGDKIRTLAYGHWRIKEIEQDNEQNIE